MRVAVAWNSPDDRVVHNQGLPNPEPVARDTVRELAAAIDDAGHDVRIVPGDIDLVTRLEGWLGHDDMVFNLSYGVQGPSRYAHVPGLLEMAGLRYTGSGPLAHALCLEKPLVKTVLRANGIPTPDGFTIDPATEPATTDDHGIGYPLVVKPCREAASLGLALVEDRDELHDAIAHVHEHFRQPALVERFLPGPDIMVPILGNDAPEILPIVQARAQGGGPDLVTNLDKSGLGRPLESRCPAPLAPAQRQQARAVALAAYRLVGCRDWARVDMRMSREGELQILEINSLPGLGPHSALPLATKAAGMTRSQFAQRILDAATRRYRRPAHVVGVTA